MTKYLLVFAAALTLAVAVPTQSSAVAMIEIVDFDTQQPSISVHDSNVRITNANGQTLSIYNVAGVCVKVLKIEGADKTFDLNLPKGCYILKVGKVVRKVSIK